MSIDGLTEHDQILVPTSTGVKSFPLLQLLGVNRSILGAASGFGMAPLHFLTQRGPFQDGETPLDMRYDTRMIQIVMSETLANMTRLADRRWELVDLLRPSRSFDYGSGVTPLIYRKWLPGGKMERGTDLSTTAGDTLVTSLRGKFVHNGLHAGMPFVLPGVPSNHIVTAVVNDYTAYIAPAPAATATNVHWRYVRGQSIRDLYCLLEVGPSFKRSNPPSQPFMAGYVEALRFVAHDPFWYGDEQSQAWRTPADLGDLIFDYPSVACLDAGAWFGAATGTGRWLFASDYVGDNVDIIYWGHEGTFPTIEITGPADNPTITNSTTGVVLSLTYSIIAGETVTLDMRNLSITNNLGTNLFQYLSGDLATFSLMPEPQAPDRINNISVAYSGATTDSVATIHWRNKYASL